MTLVIIFTWWRNKQIWIFNSQHGRVWLKLQIWEAMPNIDRDYLLTRRFCIFPLLASRVYGSIQTLDKSPAELNKVLQHNSATVSRAKAKRWVRESRRKWHALRCEQTPHFIQLWPQWAQRRAVLISLSKYLNNIPTNFYIESGSNPLVISLTKSQTTIPTITIYHNCQRNDLIWFIFKESASADQSGSLEFDINWKNNISERGKFSAF